MRVPFRGLRSPRAAAVAGALLVALAGLALVLLGVAKATVWAPETVTVVRVPGQAGAPVVVTSAAVTALDGPSLQVDVRGPAGRQAFVGVGRADDVAAYLANAARTEVTGVRDGRGELKRAGSESRLPDPSAADVWAAGATGAGTATLTWPQVPGRWQVVAAVDGATPPAEVVLTWQRARSSSAAPALFAVGGVLLVLGLVGAWAARRAARPAVATARRPEPAPVSVAGRLGGPARRPPADAAADAADDDEPEDEVAPAPFRQPPGGIS